MSVQTSRRAKDASLSYEAPPNPYAFRQARNVLAMILLRFSRAYADLALWVAPWASEEDRSAPRRKMRPHLRSVDDRNRARAAR